MDLYKRVTSAVLTRLAVLVLACFGLAACGSDAGPTPTDSGNDNSVTTYCDSYGNLVYLYDEYGYGGGVAVIEDAQPCQ